MPPSIRHVRSRWRRFSARMPRFSGSTSTSGAPTSLPPMACFHESRRLAADIWRCIRKSSRTGPRRPIVWASPPRVFVMSARTCAQLGLDRTTLCARAAPVPTSCQTIQNWIWTKHRAAFSPSAMRGASRSDERLLAQAANSLTIAAQSGAYGKPIWRLASGQV